MNGLGGSVQAGSIAGVGIHFLHYFWRSEFLEELPPSFSGRTQVSELTRKHGPALFALIVRDRDEWEDRIESHRVLGQNTKMVSESRHQRGHVGEVERFVFDWPVRLKSKTLIPAFAGVRMITIERTRPGRRKQRRLRPHGTYSDNSNGRAKRGRHFR